MVFVESTIIPPVTDDSMLGRKGSGQVGCLGRAGKPWHDRFDHDRFSSGFSRKGHQAGRVLAQKSITQADNIEYCRPGAIGTPALHHLLCSLKGLVPSVQVFDGSENLFFVHGVDLNPFPDALNQGDGEFTAEMFTEFLKTLED